MYELVSSRQYSQKSAVIRPYPVLVKSSRPFKSHSTKIHYPAIHTHIPSLQAFQPKLFLYFLFPPHPSDLLETWIQIKLVPTTKKIHLKAPFCYRMLSNWCKHTHTCTGACIHARARAHTHIHTLKTYVYFYVRLPLISNFFTHSHVK